MRRTGLNPIMAILRRVSKYLLVYRGLFFLTVLLAVFSMLFGIAVPRIIRWIFDHILAPGNLDGLWLGIAVILGCYLMRDILNGIRIRVNNNLEQRVLIDLRREIHEKLLELPVSFYDRRKSGEVASRVIEDVQNLERGLLDGTEQGITSILMIVGITTMLFTMQAGLAWAVIAPLPVLFFFMRSHWKNTRVNWKYVREAAGDLNSLVVEDIQGNRLIQSFALQSRERSRFDEQAELLRDRTLKAMYRWSWYNPTSNFIGSLGTLAVVGIGGYLIIEEQSFSTGELLAFFLYAGMLYEPLNRLHGLNHMLAAAVASGKRVFEVLDHDVAVKNIENPKPFPAASQYEIRYEGVEFAYPERDQVIHSLNLILPAGRMTALVGHTGAGKSTIANLLLRYYDVNEGRVAVNGVDVREIDLTDLRSNIGYVAQDPFLFDGTVRDNLMLARPDATAQELRECLEGACAWSFVSKLPQGVDTMVGEKGVRLSQGEKQRLTIARVLLRNPPLVVLDEATASVDTQTERYIQQALENLMQGRTVLVIAHRLSTVRKADQIVVLEHGNIVESGDHESLLAEEGHYAGLWRYQNDLIPENA